MTQRLAENRRLLIEQLCREGYSDYHVSEVTKHARTTVIGVRKAAGIPAGTRSGPKARQHVPALRRTPEPPATDPAILLYRLEKARRGIHVRPSQRKAS